MRCTTKCQLPAGRRRHIKYPSLPIVSVCKANSPSIVLKHTQNYLEPVHNLGFCGYVLTIFSYFVIAITAPLSLFFCIKVLCCEFLVHDIYAIRLFESMKGPWSSGMFINLGYYVLGMFSDWGDWFLVEREVLFRNLNWHLIFFSLGPGLFLVNPITGNNIYKFRFCIVICVLRLLHESGSSRAFLRRIIRFCSFRFRWFFRFFLKKFSPVMQSPWLSTSSSTSEFRMQQSQLQMLKTPVVLRNFLLKQPCEMFWERKHWQKCWAIENR
jgi:hypothetical protein